MKSPTHVAPHAARHKIPRGSSRSGFSLIELLVSIAVLAILAAILLSVTSRVRDAVRKARCSSNLRSLHGAAMLWVADNKGKMPDSGYWQDRATSPLSRTRYHITPYLGLSAESSNGESWTDQDSPLKCDAADELNSSTSHWGRTYSINVWACASHNGNPRSDTTAHAQNIRVIARPSSMALFMDGAPFSAPGNPSGYWSNVQESHTQPARDPGKLQYPHNHRINVVFVDGHVRDISESELGVLADSGNFWNETP